MTTHATPPEKAGLSFDGPRACKPAEVREVIALVDVEMGRVGTGQSILTDYPLVYADGNLENIRILKVNGELASVVPYFPWPFVMPDCRFNVGIISPTATATHHRKKGYGLLCLNDCLRKMEAAGCEVSLLWTRVPTFLFYENADFQPVISEALIYNCGKADAKLFADHGEKVIRYDPATREHLSAMQAMHERETVGIWRPAERYPFMFNLPRIEPFVALRNGQPVGYLIVSHAFNKPGLLEAGGDETAVETLVHHALSKLSEDAKIPGYANVTPTLLGRLLERKLPGRSQGTGKDQMIRINQPLALFRRMAKHLEKQNGGAERLFSLGVDGECISFEFSKRGLNLGTTKLKPHVELSRRELAAVIFGAHPLRPVQTPPEIGGLFSLHFPIGVLDHS